MTITTPMADQLAIARRYEVEGRWSQAAEAYGAALATFRHPTSQLLSDDVSLLNGLKRLCEMRSREMVSNTITAPTEEAKQLFDQQTRRAAETKDTGSASPVTGDAA